MTRTATRSVIGLGFFIAAAIAPAAVSQDVPPRCDDLFALNANVSKKSDRTGELGAELDEKHWGRLSANYTDEALVATFRAATEEAEIRTASLTGLSAPDFRHLVFERSKSVLTQKLTDDPGIPSHLLKQLVERVSGVTLISAAQYVEAYVGNEKAGGSSLPDTQLRSYGYRQYMSSCGRNGLSPNAFHDQFGTTQFIVVCPGLLLDAHDYGISQQDLITTLSYTMGHELGHAIDASIFPHLYGEMGRCYQDITGYPLWDYGTLYGTMRDEIVADHWGAVVLAEVLRTRPGGPVSPDGVARIIAYATNPYGETTDDPDGEPQLHAPPAFRVNQTLARHPDMVQLLRCPVAGPGNPTCTLGGKLLATPPSG